MHLLGGESEPDRWVSLLSSAANGTEAASMLQDMDTELPGLLRSDAATLRRSNPAMLVYKTANTVLDAKVERGPRFKWLRECAKRRAGPATDGVPSECRGKTFGSKGNTKSCTQIHGADFERVCAELSFGAAGARRILCHRGLPRGYQS